MSLLCMRTLVPLLSLIVITISSDAPLIGILTIPCVSEPSYCSDNDNATSFFYASYVKWIEAGGGRVVPIQSDMAHDKVRNLLSQLNGVLFTGGGASFNISTSIYFQQVANIMHYLLQFSSTNQGKAIPLWATCLGFEAISVYIANDHSILTSKYAEDMALPIQFTSNALTSTMFGIDHETMEQEYVQSVYAKLSTENLTINFHKYGVDPSAWMSNKYLQGNMSLLGSSMDANGTWFGTLQESKNDGENTFQYIYASQFHPEKPSFIFDAYNGTNNIPHSLDAIYANQYFAEFFVNECRLRNDNKMRKRSPEQLYWFANPNKTDKSGNKTHNGSDRHSEHKMKVSAATILWSVAGALMIFCFASMVHYFYQRWKQIKMTTELRTTLTTVTIKDQNNEDASCKATTGQ
eukprot:525639_1